MSDENNKPADHPQPAPQPQNQPINPSVDLGNNFQKGGEPKQDSSKIVKGK